MPNRDGFDLRRDHGFRNPPVQPPCPFPGLSGVWQHQDWPPSSAPSAPSSGTTYKNGPQATFNFRRAPGPWRSDEPHYGHNRHQPPPGVRAGQHPDNERDASRISGSDSGAAQKVVGVEGAVAAGATVPGGDVVATVTLTPASSRSPRNAGGAILSAGDSADGKKISEPGQEEERSTQDTATASSGKKNGQHRTQRLRVATTAGETDGIHEEETGGAVVASPPAEEDTPQEQDPDERGIERGTAGESVLETMGMGDDGVEEGGEEEEAEGGDPDQGWMLSAEWEEYLRNSPGVSKYFQRMKATVSTWKDGRGKKGSRNNNNKSGRKKSAGGSSTGGDKPDQDAKQTLTGNDKSSSSPSIPSAKQRRGHNQPAAASRGGKKSSKKQPKKKDSAAGGSGGKGDSDPAAAVAIAKEALELELAKIEVQALLYAEQQQHRRVEDAVLDAVVPEPE